MNTSSLQPLWRLCLSASVQAVVFVLLFSSSSFAQALRLDSLWGKIVGDVNAMTFSPDSRHLLIAGGDSWLRIFNALDGKLLDSVAPRYGCRRLKYSPDGSLLFAMGTRGIHVFRVGSYETVDSIPLQLHERNDYDSWCEEIDIAPDGRHIAVKGSWHTGTPTDNYMRMVVLSYPEKQRVWSKDLPGVSGNTALARGAVAFSLDGNYLLGQWGSTLARWDWHKSGEQPEVLVDNLPNLDLLAFSPDRNYFVLKSNYIYNVPDKKLLNPNIPELTPGNTSDYGVGVAFTKGGNTAVVTDNYFPQFVNLNQKTIILKTVLRSSYLIDMSSDSSLFASRYGSGIVRVHRMNWELTPVEEPLDSKINIVVSPLPSNEQTSVSISTVDDVPDCSISITDLRGITLRELYKGLLIVGKNTFVLDNRSLPSGNYYLSLVAGNTRATQPFIIAK